MSACAATQDWTGCTCPEPYTSCAGRCYVFFDWQWDHATSWRRCNELAHILPVPRTDQDMACLHAIAGGKRVWLGLIRSSEGDHFDADDGREPFGLNHRFWSPGKPDTPNGNCVELLADGWNDVFCGNSGPGDICQMWEPAVCPS